MSPSSSGKSSEKLRVIDVRPSLRSGVSKALYKAFGGPIESMLGIKEFNAAYRRIATLKEPGQYWVKCLNVFRIEYIVPDEDLARIPKEGPVFVVANHPYGGADGVVLGAILAGARGDFKLLANSMLGRMEGIRPWLIPVNPFGTKDAARENLRSMKAAMKHLSAGGCLATFPSGEVSSLHPTKGGVTDPQWSPHIARMVRQSNATVLPIYFDGRNSSVFQAAGLMHPLARTALLTREFIGMRDRVIRLRIGNPIPFNKLKDFETDEALIEFLRLNTYMLSRRMDGAQKKIERTTEPVAAQEPIIAAVPPALLKAELDTLPPEAMLAESAGFKVYHFHGDTLPHTLREIGRLREVTFRAVSEGTGRACDTDEFDTWYEHLVLWDPKANAIAGAYRMGRTDFILENHGKKGLYTSTLFHFRTGFFMKLNPALEMGRSFIVKEYQRKPACLPLLWRGIAGYAIQHPKYTKLFGPVSINPEYSAASRDLILAYLKNNKVATDLASLVRAKNPPRRLSLKGADLEALIRSVCDIDQVSSLVSELEADKKPVPVLLKHYLKLNGQMLSFNIDPDFGECLDGLVLVDLLKVDPRFAINMMGDDGYRTFCAYHKRPLPAHMRDKPAE